MRENRGRAWKSKATPKFYEVLEAVRESTLARSGHTRLGREKRERVCQTERILVDDCGTDLLERWRLSYGLKLEFTTGDRGGDGSDVP